MARILVSWVAFNNDFILDKGKPNPEGPTAKVHKYFFTYDYHLLLSNGSPGDIRTEFLVNYLNKTYGHKIIEKYLLINDVIDLKEISAKICEVLLEHRKDEIDIFISPGTPSMQVAWYLAHLELGLKTRLFQTRPEKFNKKGLPEQVWVDFERSSVTSSLIIREHLSNSTTDTKIKITASVKPVYEMAARVAANNITILISGETGTGKEGLAKFIHNSSPRANSPFKAINCSAMNDQLLESRLFGHKKGAFTGADKEVQGYFQDANNGTIFLDEIGDISPYMQQVLLRALQEKKITMVGSTNEDEVDVRIIAATNKNLVSLCNEGKFRRDLFYRLSVLDLTLSPLRERGVGEIEEIFNFLMEKKKKEFNMPEPKFSRALKKKLFAYSFPGNIRELENIVERIYALSVGEVVEKDLEKLLYIKSEQTSLKLIDVENDHIKKVLKLCDYNKQKASKILGIVRNTLEKRILDYKLD